MSTGPSKQRFWSRFALYTTIGLSACAVLFMGGVHPWVQWSLSVGGLALFAIFVFVRRHRKLRWPPFATMLLAAWAITIAQLVPLPAGLVAWLSPRALAWRSEIAPEGLSFLPVTLDVPATVIETLKFATYLGVLLIVSQYASKRSRVREWLKLLVGLGTLVVVLAIAHRALGAERFLGIYRPQSETGRGFYGPFVNGNHAASVFGLTCLLSIGLFAGAQRPLKWAYAGAAGLSFLALLLTNSRAGLAALLVSVLLLGVWILRTRYRLWQAVVVCTIGLAIVSVGGLFFFESFAHRISHDTVGPKVTGWLDGLRLARDFIPLGVGRGAFEGPVGTYRTGRESVRLIFPENILVQLLAEWGVIFTIVFCGLGLIACRRLLRQMVTFEIETVAAALAIGYVALHDMFDFGLEMMGVALPVVVLLGIVAGRTYEQEKNLPEHPIPSRRTRGVWTIAVWAVLVPLGAWAAGRTVHADSMKLQATHAAEQSRVRLTTIRQMIDRHPTHYYFELWAARTLLIAKQPAAAMHHVNRALRLQPHGTSAHRFAARTLAAGGHPEQAALEYRLHSEEGFLLPKEEAMAVLRAHIVDAVPQYPEPLLEIGKYLAGSGKPEWAEQAFARAEELTGSPKLAETVALTAYETADKFVLDTWRERSLAHLMEKFPSPRSFQLAVQAAAKKNQRDNLDLLFNLAKEKNFLDHGLLVAFVAAFAMVHDYARASDLLMVQPSRVRTLPEKIEVESWRAQIAEAVGDDETATLARVRQRLLKHQSGK